MKTTMKVNKMLSNKTYFQQNLIHFSCSRCAMKQIAGVNFIIPANILSVVGKIEQPTRCKENNCNANPNTN